MVKLWRHARLGLRVVILLAWFWRTVSESGLKAQTRNFFDFNRRLMNACFSFCRTKDIFLSIFLSTFYEIELQEGVVWLQYKALNRENAF